MLIGALLYYYCYFKLTNCRNTFIRYTNKKKLKEAREVNDLKSINFIKRLDSKIINLIEWSNKHIIYQIPSCKKYNKCYPPKSQ